MVFIFSITSIFTFLIGLYLMFQTSFNPSTMFVCSFISLSIIAALKGVKIKCKDFSIEYKNREQKNFVDIAIELLENNFPILSKVGQKEVNIRVSNWLKLFISELENRKITLNDSKIFYDPDFQFVLNKAIELVGRKNNELQNKALIHFLISRIKYNDSENESLISQIDSTIINDIPRLTESHYKLMCLVKLLEEITTILKSVIDLETFNMYVMQAIDKFLIEDIRCYEDLQKTSLIHNGGNPRLSNPKEEDRSKPLYDTNGRIVKPIRPKRNLWEYFVDVFPFLTNISETEKAKIIENETYKKCDILYQHVLKYIMLLPFAHNLIYGYAINKLQELPQECFENKNAEDN